jgi:aminomethyltransferase
MDNVHTIKETALAAKHRQLGAKMVEFAGFQMPLQYSGLLQEHGAVRKNIGLFDVSHMGEFKISGTNALALIQWATSNDAERLFPGKVQYSCLMNPSGGIVDDLLVYQLETNQYMLVVNASNIEKDWAWLESLNEKFGAEMENISDETSLLAVQGPKAVSALQKLTPTSLIDIPYYSFHIAHFAGFEKVIISNTGYTGSGGFEIYVPNDIAEEVWDQIFEAGKEFGLMPAGLGARDTLRLEMGFCLYGNELSDSSSPLEAGLGWITKLKKDFVGREYLLEQQARGLKRKLVGFEMIDKGIPRKDYPILDDSGEIIGIVTSGTQSPSLHKAIGIGFVKHGAHAVGTSIHVEVRGKALLAKVVEMPFYKNGARSN